MIYTVTFNPALDYVVTVEKLKDGQVNRTFAEHVYYGGKGINVSMVLRTLGFDSIALGFIAGFTGKEIEHNIREAGIRTQMIDLEQGLSRINVKIRSQEETELNASGPDIPQKKLEQLLSQIDSLKDGDILVLAGSIPYTLPDDIYERIMEQLSDRKVQIIVDATKDLLKNVLKYHPFLIKPNKHELGEVFGVELNTDEEIIYYAKQLQAMGARNVLISMAKDGAILLDENQKVYRIGVPKGKVLNSVGAGDSMVAGFLAGYLESGEYETALKLGTAAGSATAFSEGLAVKKDIDLLLQKL